MILWSGGAKTRHTVRLPPPGEQARTAPEVIDRIRSLARHHPDHRIAELLNAAGVRTRTGKAWSYDRVGSMRRQYGIPTGCPLHPKQPMIRADGLMSARMAADRLGISPSLVHVWVRQGALRYDQHRPGSKLWVRLGEADIARLDGSATAMRLPTIAAVMAQERITRDEVWDLVRSGRYLAYRTAHGRLWTWRLKRCEPPDLAPARPGVGSGRDGGTQYG